MPWFRTVYPSFEKLPRIETAGVYGGDLWARDLRDAVRIAKARGLGERIVGGPNRSAVTHRPVSDMIRKRENWDAVLHCAIYTGWAALKTGLLGVDEILGDGGLVHQIIHAKAGVRGRGYRERLIDHARRIEWLIPGWTK